MTDSTQLRGEVHALRSDINRLTEKMSTLTEVLIRKEESDKYLEKRIEKLEASESGNEKRLRRMEDVVTKSTPWVDLGSKIGLAVMCALAVGYFTLK
jgi:septal ring factor EnvC (AmiA/AmiB activator)